MTDTLSTFAARPSVRVTGRRTLGEPSLVRASGISMTLTVVEFGSALAPNHFSWILASVPSCFILVISALTFSRSGLFLANIIEYCSPVGMRSTTL